MPEHPRPALYLIAGDNERSAEALREAYAFVMDGYREALTVPGLPPDEAARFRRCLGYADRVVQRNLASLAQDRPRGELAP